MEKRSSKRSLRALVAVFLILTVCFACASNAFAAGVCSVMQSGTYELFASGCTSACIPEVFMNPSPDTLTNNGNDIIARMDCNGDTAYAGCVRETRLGLSFNIDRAPASDIHLFICAYDVDSNNGEHDSIYLVDETNGTREKVGVLTGKNEKWVENDIIIPQGSITVGATYHLELYVANTNFFVNATWLVGVRSVKMTVITESAPEISFALTYDANGAQGAVPEDKNAYAADSTVGVAFAPIPVYDGYRFLGWSTDKNAAEPEFAADGAISFKITADTVLYAVWTDIPPVCYDAVFVVDSTEYRRVFEEGETPWFDGDTLLDKNDGKKYTFTGWDAYKFNSDNILEFFGYYDLTTELPDMTENMKFIAKYEVENAVTDTFILSVTMKTGEIMRLSVDGVTAEYKVYWASSNEEAAQVESDGTVKALAPGNTIVTAVVCDGNGNITEIGYINIRVVPQDEHVHSYTASVVAPTCTEQGYTEYLCICGENYRADYVHAAGHDFVKGETVAPTCEDAGYTLFVCKNCGKEMKRNYEPRLGHADSNGDNICDVCGEEIFIRLPNVCSVLKDFFASIINFIISAFTGLGRLC